MNPQALELNNIIKDSSSVVYNFLSEKGKHIFFPKKGILAQAADAKGKEINATIGIALEDNGAPVALNKISSQIDLDTKDTFPYAPSYGKKELREIWKKQNLKKNQSFEGNMSLPVVTSGITHALSTVGYLFVDNRDKIIIPDMIWGNYKLLFQNAFGAELKYFSTFNESGFNITGLIDTIKTTAGKKIILLNFPNNPTGYTPTIDEVKTLKSKLLELAENGEELMLILDDAYFGLVYEDQVYQESLLSIFGNLHPNIFVVKLDGATKEDYVWGFRVGFISYSSKDLTSQALTALEDKTAGAIRGNISNSSHLSQSLVYSALVDDNYVLEKQEKYQLLRSRFEKVKQIFIDNPQYSKYFKPLPYNSGYFMCIELIDTIMSEEIRQILLEKYSTGIIALGQNLIRIAYSSVPESSLSKLFQNIFDACESIQ